MGSDLFFREPDGGWDMGSQNHRRQVATQVLQFLASGDLCCKPMAWEDLEYAPRFAADKFTDGDRWYFPAGDDSEG